MRERDLGWSDLVGYNLIMKCYASSGDSDITSQHFILFTGSGCGRINIDYSGSVTTSMKKNLTPRSWTLEPGGWNVISC